MCRLNSCFVLPMMNSDAQWNESMHPGVMNMCGIWQRRESRSNPYPCDLSPVYLKIKRSVHGNECHPCRHLRRDPDEKYDGAQIELAHQDKAHELELRVSSGREASSFRVLRPLHQEALRRLWMPTRLGKYSSILDPTSFSTRGE